MAAAVLVLGATPGTLAMEEVEFADTAIFFEFNSTDLDLGIQIFFDAEAWEKVRVAGPGGKIFAVRNGGGLREIGSTEVFTEGAEPALCPENGEKGECDVDAAIAEFLSKFPEGTYDFTGKTIERDMLVGDAYLSWDLPTPVEIVDAVGNFPDVVWVSGTDKGDGAEVVGYEVVVEAVIEEDEEERVLTQVTQVTADVTSITTSVEFAAMVAGFEADEVLVEVKVEVLAIGANGNKTITEEAVFELDSGE